MRHLPSSPYGSSPSSSSSSSLPPSLSAPSASPSAPSVFLEFHQKHVLWKIKRCARCAGPPGFRAQLLLLSCAHRFKIRPSVLIIFIPTVICRLHCSLPSEVVVSCAPFLFHQKRAPHFENLFSGLFIGSTAPSFLKENLRKIWRYRTVVFRFGKCSGSIALNLLKGNPSENFDVIGPLSSLENAAVR